MRDAINELFGSSTSADERLTAVRRGMGGRDGFTIAECQRALGLIQIPEYKGRLQPSVVKAIESRLRRLERALSKK